MRSASAFRVSRQQTLGKQTRYEVDLTLDWKDVKKEVLVTLNDRSDLDHALLIGRNFFMGDFFVDVEKNIDD